MCLFTRCLLTIIYYEQDASAMKKTVIILKMYERAESIITISCTRFNWAGNTSIQISIFKFLSVILGSNLWVLSVHMSYSIFENKETFQEGKQFGQCVFIYYMYSHKNSVRSQLYFDNF